MPGKRIKTKEKPEDSKFKPKKRPKKQKNAPIISLHRLPSKTEVDSPEINTQGTPKISFGDLSTPGGRRFLNLNGIQAHVCEEQDCEESCGSALPIIQDYTNEVQVCYTAGVPGEQAKGN